MVGVAAALSEAAGEAAGAEAAGGAREAKLGAVTAAEAMWPQRHAAADGSRERSRTPQRAECAWQSLLVRALCGHSLHSRQRSPIKRVAGGQRAIIFAFLDSQGHRCQSARRTRALGWSLCRITRGPR